MAYPDLQPGWIDALHRRISLGRFELESGEHIDDAFVSYVVHGSLDDGGHDARPVVLGLCAIGSTHHRLDFLIGPGRVFDPAKMTIVVDALGNGLSNSPSNSPTQGGERFPRFTIRDMVRSQKALLERLGIEHVEARGRIDGRHAGAAVGRVVVSVVHAKADRARADGEDAPWSQAVNLAVRSVHRTAPGSP